MARLIDADWLMELYNMGKELEGYAAVLSVPLPVVRQNIKDAPTVDAVEVVRCRECKHENVYRAISDKNTWCEYWGIDPSFDDFCSYGERKEK